MSLLRRFHEICMVVKPDENGVRSIEVHWETYDALIDELRERERIDDHYPSPFTQIWLYGVLLKPVGR